MAESSLRKPFVYFCTGAAFQNSWYFMFIQSLMTCLAALSKIRQAGPIPIIVKLGKHFHLWCVICSNKWTSKKILCLVQSDIWKITFKPSVGLSPTAPELKQSYFDLVRCYMLQYRGTRLLNGLADCYLMFVLTTDETVQSQMTDVALYMNLERKRVYGSSPALWRFEKRLKEFSLLKLFVYKCSIFGVVFSLSNCVYLLSL